MYAYDADAYDRQTLAGYAMHLLNATFWVGSKVRLLFDTAHLLAAYDKRAGELARGWVGSWPGPRRSIHPTPRVPYQVLIPSAGLALHCINPTYI